MGVSLTYKIVKIVSNEPGKREKYTDSVSRFHPSSKSVPKLSLKEYFESNGFFTIDCRGWDGCLWILGDAKKLAPYVDEAREIYGATGGYGSGKQTGYSPAWWTKCKK